MVKNSPFIAGIELTNACNLKCEYCYVDKQKHNEFSFNIVTSIVTALQKMGTRVILLTGGEIFLHSDIKKIVKYIEEKKMLMVLYTNGTIPLLGYRDILDSPWVFRCEITMYGSSDETYAVFCKNRTAYNTLLENLKFLKSYSKKVILKIVPTSYNVSDVDAMLDLAREMGLEVNINTLVFGNNVSCKSCIINDDTMRSIVGKLLDDSEVNRRDAVTDMPNRLCGAGRYSICICHNGDVKACFISNDIAGNIFENSLYKIWDTSEYFKTRRNYHYEYCDTCEDNLYCFICSEIVMMEGNALKNRSSEICRQARIRKEVIKWREKSTPNLL
jgi:MoaA/NifB/PqqE/SkfB family radical SAM enzyme